MESHPLLHLIERMECKRRWSTDSCEDMQEDALTAWVLDRLEAPELWGDSHGPRVLSIAQLADQLRADTDLREVLALLTGRPDLDLTTELARLVKDEAVPFLAAYRYKEPGLRKREAWEETWELQRREDNGEDVGDIPVPPKYKSSDFRAISYWRHRGKLDVPKERFIAYPDAGRDGDKTPVIGWAGWNHLDQAQALARLILDRAQQEGWDAERLTTLLAGIAELEPWLHQWHADIDPTYGGSPAAFYTAFLEEQLQKNGLTRHDLTTWRPRTGGRTRAGR
ncbi:MAG: BREX-2 system adenine-specific DNA-methyltransferase PglX [bacterium]